MRLLHSLIHITGIYDKMIATHCAYWTRSVYIVFRDKAKRKTNGSHRFNITLDGSRKIKMCSRWNGTADKYHSHWCHVKCAPMISYRSTNCEWVSRILSEKNMNMYVCVCVFEIQSTMQFVFTEPIWLLSTFFHITSQTHSIERLFSFLLYFLSHSIDISISLCYDFFYMYLNASWKYNSHSNLMRFGVLYAVDIILWEDTLTF